jgi:putative addiction module component (TIGR02574 family)
MISLTVIRDLPLHEKLKMMEALWDGIAQQESQLDMPQWHKDLIDEREALVQSGKARFIDWETAKQEINDAPKNLSLFQ